MGIRGIYRELGPGKRVSLSKLAADCFERSHRPFRLAIDIAIWQFQNQAARGGTNPAIRTLFYRLVRLLGTPIQPVFVFDGPNKPKFKRNKRSGRGDGVATAQAKRLIRLFGFATHDAPGEAEAECAFLQKNGIVDAVLSEDVDTIMFGCTRTLRNWSAEGKSTKAPTHVSLYDVQEMNIASLGLDREGMVLVALMSGGDYLPEGVPGCGVKVACEAARGGFGKSLCRLKSSDIDGVRQWRQSLLHELRTNEKSYFRVRHKAMTIPDDFPNLEILRYYTHPVVSQQVSLAGVEQKLSEKTDFHLEALREFTRETFDWDYRIGAIKFIRVLSQAVLVNRLQQGNLESEDLVKKISGRRNHFSCDGESELRVTYIPEEIVPIDLSKEVEEDLSYGRDGLALNSDEEFEPPAGSTMAEGSQAGPAKVFDVAKPDLAWVLEGIARRSASDMVRAWEEQQQAKAKPKALKKKGPERMHKIAPVSHGSLDKFVRITKATADKAVTKSKEAPRPREGFALLSQALPRRQGTPPPLRQQMQQPLGGMSKQSSATMAATTTTDAEDCFASSSPVTPRPRAGAGARTGNVGEPIEIPSSPPEPALLQNVPPASPIAPLPVYPGRKDVVHSVRSNVSSSNSRQETSGGLRKAAAVTEPSAASRTSQARLTQTSMDMFTTKDVQPLHTRAEMSRANEKPGSVEKVGGRSTSNKGNLGKTHETDLSDVEIISPPTMKTSTAPSSKNTQKQTSSRPRRAETETKSLGRKKLLVPSASGFFDEIEVGEDECEERIAREARRLEERGVRGGSGVLRWDDFEVIDLTG